MSENLPPPLINAIWGDDLGDDEQAEKTKQGRKHATLEQMAGIGFSSHQAAFLIHLGFIQRLNEQQNFKLSSEFMIESALKLTEIGAIETTAIGGIYEDSLQKVADAIARVSASIEELGDSFRDE